MKTIWSLQWSLLFFDFINLLYSLFYLLIDFRKFLRCICSKKSLITVYFVPQWWLLRQRIILLLWHGFVFLESSFYIFITCQPHWLWKVILLLMGLETFYNCFLCPYQGALQSNFFIFPLYGLLRKYIYVPFHFFYLGTICRFWNISFLFH